jgi:hypothetical protein
MDGPSPIAEWIFTAVRTESDRTEFPRGIYRVVQAFVDCDGDRHPVGESWLLMLTGFNKFDNEFVLYVSFDLAGQWSIPLWWSPAGQEDVIEGFSRFAKWIGPPPSPFPPD